MGIHLLLLLLGFGLLILGANWLVSGASVLAKKYKVSDLAIGLTIVAFGTSSPEMVVNVIAAVQGHNDIVLGNIIGSNNFNIFFILGIAGLITPLVVQSSTIWKEVPLSMLAIAFFFVLANDFFMPGEPGFSRLDGCILLVLFGIFLYMVFIQMKNDTASIPLQSRLYPNWKIWGLIVFGLVGLVAGGRFVVNSAVEIATVLGLSNKMIGLTVVAAGSSLPELAASVVAAVRKNNDIAVGNIIGSNIFNIFFVLGISTVIHPIQYNPIFNFEVFLLAFGTLLLFASMFTGEKKRLDRWEAGLLLMVYLVYMTNLVQSGK